MIKKQEHVSYLKDSRTVLLKTSDYVDKYKRNPENRSEHLKDPDNPGSFLVSDEFKEAVEKGAVVRGHEPHVYAVLHGMCETRKKQLDSKEQIHKDLEIPKVKAGITTVTDTIPCTVFYCKDKQAYDRAQIQSYKLSDNYFSKPKIVWAPPTKFPCFVLSIDIYNQNHGFGDIEDNYESMLEYVRVVLGFRFLENRNSRSLLWEVYKVISADFNPMSAACLKNFIAKMKKEEKDILVNTEA